MNVPGITNPDMSATINGAIKAGWVYDGTAKNHTVGRIRWPRTGAVVNFSTTPRSGGWKTTAQMIYAESGVDLRRKGSNRRSRKNFTTPQQDAQVDASRRRHADEFARRAEQEKRVRALEEAERRRREIERLMRP